MKKSSKTQHLTKGKAKASAARPTAASCEKHSVDIAVLQQATGQTADRFDRLTDRFDRILVSVEKLAVDTASLSTRHDTQIQALQKQTSNVEDTVNELRATVNEIPDRIARQVNEVNTKTTNEFHEKTKETSTVVRMLDDRVLALERWRWILVGVGVAAAAVVEFLYRIFT